MYRGDPFIQVSEKGPASPLIVAYHLAWNSGVLIAPTLAAGQAAWLAWRSRGRYCAVAWFICGTVAIFAQLNAVFFLDWSCYNFSTNRSVFTDRIIYLIGAGAAASAMVLLPLLAAWMLLRFVCAPSFPQTPKREAPGEQPR
jgi:hypothetical protein